MFAGKIVLTSKEACASVEKVIACHRNPVADAEIQRWSYKVDPDLSACRAAVNCDCKPFRSYMSLILCMFSFGEKERKSP